MKLNETIENLNCQGCQIQQPVDQKNKNKNKNKNKTKTLTEVLYHVFWSILSQMKHVCCELKKKKKKKMFLNLYAVLMKFSMPAIDYRILHLASQTMYFGVSYFVRYGTLTRPQNKNMVSLQVILFLKMFGTIWIDKSTKNDLKFPTFC